MGTVADRVKTAKHREYLANPKVQAILKTIRVGEGTSGEDGYVTRVGGGKFNDFSSKPGKRVYIKSIDDYSTAEGAYQFLNKTWEGTAKRLGLSDFSPESQDIAAVDLILHRGAMDNILGDDFEGAIDKLAPEWASLPKKDGRGYYSGQKARSMESLYKVYSDGKPMSRPKTSFTNFEMEENRGNLATVPDQEEKPEVAEAVNKLNEKQNEENFLKSMFSKEQEDFTVPEPKKVVAQQIAPTNTMDTYDKIDSFVEAQQGGAIERDKEWLQNWYGNRVIPNKDINDIYQKSKSEYEDLSHAIPNPIYKGFIPSGEGITDLTSQAVHTKDNEIMMVSPENETTFTHEADHFIYTNANAQDMNDVHNNVVKYNLAPQENIRNPNIKSNYQYYSTPTEVHSRVQEFRKKAGFKPNQELKKEDIDRFKKTYKGGTEGINDLFDMTDTEHLLEIMNNMADNNKRKPNNLAQQGGMTRFLKQKVQPREERYLTKNDNLKVSNYNNAKFFNPSAKNKTDKEIATEREAKIQASVEAQKVPYTKENWRRQLAAETATTGDKLRISNEPNFFDDYINPAVMVGNMASDLGQAPLQAEQLNSILPYVTSVGTPLTVGAIGGLGTKTTGQFVNNLANPLAGTGDLVNSLGNKYLPNAYKYNPVAKGNVFNKFSEDSFLRQVDDATYKEGLESGFIRGKQDIDMTRGEGIININKSFGDDAYYKKGSPYYPNQQNYPFMYEVRRGEEAFIPKVNGRTRKYTTDNTNIRVSKEPIPLDEADVYKHNWLQGYKQVEVPKVDNFKSEIDWIKWNKEIPENPQLMKEYNTIEQTSKANGSWMKNSDGSVFQGTPEQFVQQNSQNFKKAFGNTKVTDNLGNPLVTYHGTREKFNIFDMDRKGSRFHGNGVYTSPFQDISVNYSRNGNMLPLYSNIENPVIKDLSLDLNGKDIPVDFDGVIAYNSKGEHFSQLRNAEIVTPKSNQLKSATGNNGMFNMTDPNIYKSIAPIVGASYLTTQGQQEHGKLQQGGIISDNQGQWKHPGDVTKIDGGNITMKGVNYPVLGVSNLGEQKMMYPNKDYQFQGAESVIEYPQLTEKEKNFIKAVQKYKNNER